MEEAIATESKGFGENNAFPNILTSLLGSLLGGFKDMKVTEIHMEKKCMKECPKEVHNKPVHVDSSRRFCVVEDSDSPFSFLQPH